MPCSNAPKQCFFLTVRLAYRPICMLDGDGDSSGSGAMMLDGDDSFASGVEAGGIGVVGDSIAIFFCYRIGGVLFADITRYKIR